jgi:hypothetical protein
LIQTEIETLARPWPSHQQQQQQQQSSAFFLVSAATTAAGATTTTTTTVDGAAAAAAASSLSSESYVDPNPAEDLVALFSWKKDTYFNGLYQRVVAELK